MVVKRPLPSAGKWGEGRRGAGVGYHRCQAKPRVEDTGSLEHLVEQLERGDTAALNPFFYLEVVSHFFSKISIYIIYCNTSQDIAEDCNCAIACNIAIDCNILQSVMSRKKYCNNLFEEKINNLFQ